MALLAGLIDQEVCIVHVIGGIQWDSVVHKLEGGWNQENRRKCSVRHGDEEVGVVRLKCIS